MMLAPARVPQAGFHVSFTVVAIVVVLALVGIVVILGWRAPDRSPGAETKAERERIDD